MLDRLVHAFDASRLKFHRLRWALCSMAMVLLNAAMDNQSDDESIDASLLDAIEHPRIERWPLDNDLTRAVEHFSFKHNSPFIPQSHTTAIYGMEHLTIEEARARLRKVREVIPQWPTFAKPTGVTSDIAECGKPGQVCDIASSELTLATNPHHEAALDILYELFYGPVYTRDRPWKPHNSVAYDNPETNCLSLLDTIMYASQNPSLLGMERRVASIALWSTVGKMEDWRCLERVKFLE